MKISFSPDSSKQAQKVIFSRKLKKLPQLPLVFNNDKVSQCKCQKHLGILYSKLIIEEYYKTVLSKTNRTIGL